MAEKVTIGNCELYLGDCREVLPLMPRHDLLLTDPPYGIGQDGGAQRTRGSKRTNGEKVGWDNERPPAWLFGLMTEKAPAAVIWGGNYFADLLPASMGWLYWEKRMGGDFADGELAWTSMHRALRQFSYYKKNPGDEHPTQKPVELMRWCVSFAPDAQTVLDPFMGSGTTGVACAQLGKSFTGIERERKYFDIACRRIEQAYAQPRLFENAKVGAGETAVQGDMLLPANAEVSRDGTASAGLPGCAEPAGKGEMMELSMSMYATSEDYWKARAELAEKDAERYRWLREQGDSRCTEKDGYGGQSLKMGDCLDAAVDAAMALHNPGADRCPTERENANG